MNKLSVPLFLIGVLGILVLPGPASAETWTPRITDRLLKLPGNYLEKAVDKDFSNSPLAAELAKAQEKISLKKGSLEDLQSAIEIADNDASRELEFQFLAEKKRYLKLMREQQEIRKRRATTKVRFYERILRNMYAKQAGETPAQTSLLDKQRSARERFEGSFRSVDTKLFKSSMTVGSKYSQEYARNMAAVESLVQAIDAHPMNKAPEMHGRPVTQEDYLRQLIGENEAEIALVDQERAILGYMAKLVSLDALALSEDVGGDTIVADASAEAERAVAADIYLFMRR